MNFEKWKIEFEYERNRDIAEFEYGKNKDEARFGLDEERLKMQNRLNEARIAKLMSSGAGAAGGRAGSRAMQVLAQTLVELFQLILSKLKILAYQKKLIRSLIRHIQIL